MNRKLLLFILAALIMLSMSGCGVSFDPDEIEYTIYSSTSDSSSFFQESTDAAVAQVSSASDLKLDIQLAESKITVEDAPSTKTFTFENQSMEMSYSRSEVLPIQHSQYSNLQKHSVVDVYVKDKKLLKIRHSTGEVIGYYEADLSLKKANGDLTKEEASDLAAKLITQLYGKNTLKDYELKENQFIDSTWRITYTRYLFGSPTEDTIRIHFNGKGELVFLNAINFGNYQHLKDEISKEHIEYAEKLLRSSISSSWTVDNRHWLILDADGKCYVKLIAAQKDAVGILASDEFYINVN